MLQTDWVFLDAEVFVRARWALDGPLLGQYREYSSYGAVHLVFPLVTIGEIERGIREAACEAARHIKKLRSMPGAKYLHASGRVPNSRSEEEVALAAVADFRRWLQDANAEIVNLGGVPPEAVFVRYFRGDPPFGAGAKKNEFPDAFSMLALYHWCLEHDRSVYVVSQDNDLRRACESFNELIYVERGEELLDLLVRDRSHAGIWRSASLVFSSLTEHIKDAIVDNLLRKRFLVADAIGVVEGVQVEVVDILETFVLKGSQPFRYACELAIYTKVDLTYLNPRGEEVERVVPMLLETPAEVEIDPTNAESSITLQLILDDDVSVYVN